MKKVKKYFKILMIVSILLIFPTQTYSKEKQAPAFITKDIIGKTIDFKKLYKKGPVIVWFWNTCCAYKKPQFDCLKRLSEKYKNLTIITIAEDGVNKTSKIKQFAKAKKINFPVITDRNKSILKKFRAYALPALYIVDKNVGIVFSRMGYLSGDDKKIEKALKKLFASE